MEFCQRTSANVSAAFGSVEEAVLIPVAAERMVSVSRTMMHCKIIAPRVTAPLGLQAVDGSTVILKEYPRRPRRKAVLVALVQRLKLRAVFSKFDARSVNTKVTHK